MRKNVEAPGRFCARMDGTLVGFLIMGSTDLIRPDESVTIKKPCYTS